MSSNNTPAPQMEGQPPPPLLPKCPHCQTQPCPMTLGTTSWDFGPGGVAYAAIYCCAACAMILSVAPLQIPPAPQQPAKRIVMPGPMQ